MPAGRYPEITLTLTGAALIQIP